MNLILFGMTLIGAFWVFAPVANAQVCNHNVKSFKNCDELQACGFTSTVCGSGTLKKYTKGCEVKTYSICVASPESYKHCTEVGTNEFCRPVGDCIDVQDPPTCGQMAPEGQVCAPLTEIRTTNVSNCVQPQ
jgi:hypothetical protein